MTMRSYVHQRLPAFFLLPFTLTNALSLPLSTVAAPQPPQTIVVARDYALEAPETIPGPLVDIRFVNHGREPHYLRFLRVEGNRGLDDFVAWRKAGGPMPDWLRGAGGVGTIAPGRTTDFRSLLFPGRYIVMCGHPSPDGTAHVDRGMFGLITVDARTSINQPHADGTLLISDDGLELFGAPRSGSYSFYVANIGRTTHQVLIVKLPDGVAADGELAWFRSGSRGRRPGEPVGGAIELLPDQEARVRMDLQPGRYVAFCSMRHGQERHFDEGGTLEFQIGPPSQ